MKKVIRYVSFVLLYITLAIFLSIVVTQLMTTPSNNREWNLDQVILPHITIGTSTVSIENIRNFTYASTTSYTPRYYTKTFNLNDLKKVWYVVEPFSGIPGSAHTFLSFEFDNDQFVSISVEIRKEKGESFHPIKGLFNQYELMYVIADEQDVVKLRSNYRKDLVYVYPIRTTQEKAQGIFLDMLKRAQTLEKEPEFYNTLTNTCTTNIVHHVNTITPHRVPFFNLRILFPANSDRLAYDLGLIDTDLPFEKAREKFYINDKALKYAQDTNFSRKIREE